MNLLPWLNEPFPILRDLFLSSFITTIFLNDFLNYYATTSYLVRKLQVWKKKQP